MLGNILCFWGLHSYTEIAVHRFRDRRDEATLTNVIYYKQCQRCQKIKNHEHYYWDGIKMTEDYKWFFEHEQERIDVQKFV